LLRAGQDLDLPRPDNAPGATPDRIRDQVRRTVIHELARHFGIDDARLHELGWA
jgi:predicted Zn-dependent protease with MMP-like domain